MDPKVFPAMDGLYINEFVSFWLNNGISCDRAIPTQKTNKKMGKSLLMQG